MRAMPETIAWHSFVLPETGVLNFPVLTRILILKSQRRGSSSTVSFSKSHQIQNHGLSAILLGCTWFGLPLSHWKCVKHFTLRQLNIIDRYFAELPTCLLTLYQVSWGKYFQFGKSAKEWNYNDWSYSCVHSSRPSAQTILWTMVLVRKWKRLFVMALYFWSAQGP